MNKIAQFWGEISIYIVAVLVWYWWQYIHFDGSYVDTDNYTHALRMMDLFLSHHFGEQIFHYTNYPFGEILHWTRAFDLIWGVLAFPFILSAYPLKEAIFYSGLLIAPVCFIFAVYYFLRVGRLLNINWSYRLLAAILLVVQSNFVRVALLNRPDHHVLFMLLQIMIVYLMFEFIYYKQHKYLFLLAFCTAFALWVAVEGFFLFLGVALFLFCGYLFFSYSYQYIQSFFLVYTLIIAGFLIINPPYQGYFFIDNGRLSFFYVLLCAFMSGCVFLVKFISKKMYQVILLAVFACFIGLVFYLLGWFNSPFNEQIYVPFISRISEMKNGNIYILAYPLAGVLCGSWLLKYKFRDECYIFLYLNLCIYTFLTFLSMRFVPYAGLLAAFVLVLFVKNRFECGVKPIKTIIFFVFLEYISFIIHVSFSYNLTHEIKIPVIYDPTEELVKLPKGTFATDVFMCPAVIWNGGHTTVASPYHRNLEGILDNHDIFFSNDENYVLKLLNKHKVKYILMFPDLDANYYINPDKNCDKLYGKILGCQQYPSWLTPIHIGTDYYLFRVNIVS